MNRQTSVGNPGFEERRRVSGIMAKLMENSLEGSVAGYVTVLRKQSFLVAQHVLLHGVYPPAPLNIDLCNAKVVTYVSRELTNRAVKGGKTYGTPQALLVNAPWFPTWNRSVIAKDARAQQAIEPLKTMRTHFVVPAKDTYKLRNFEKTKTTGNVSELVARVSVNGGNVVAYGGGSLFKEQKIAPYSNIMNVEVGNPVIGTAPTALAINSLVQKDTVDIETLHEISQAETTVVVVPTDQKPKTAKRAMREASYAKYDDEARMQRYLDLAQNEFAPILCEGENRMLVRFKRCTLDFVGIEVTPDMPLLEEKRTKKHTAGVRIVKKKLDGVRHRIWVKGDDLMLTPREKRADMQSLSAMIKNHDGISICADIEIVGGKWHVIKVLRYGSVVFHTENAQACIEFQKKVKITIDGCNMLYCDHDSCKCECDGIVVEDLKGNAVFYKTELETDEYVKSFDGMDEFVTTTHHSDGSVIAKSRMFKKGTKNKRAIQEATIHPEVIFPYKHFLAKNKRFAIAHLPIPPSLDRAKGIGNSGAICALCKDVAMDFCKHGKFCHGHMCEECLQDLVCVKCNERGAVECPNGGYHCARASCVCEGIKKAWEFKELN